ncbi:MAG: TatD family hydrolase [Candidatus Moranbacteria bacterium]|nr:TatD family hydrolase [Candidatus Moranbacteria bacterium]
MQDIHTHLYWKSYDADRDAVVARARAAGVREMLVIGCTVDESRQAIAIAEAYTDMYATVGIHPHEMNHLVESANTKAQIPNKAQSPKDQINEWVEALRQLTKNKKVVAIGECGLDYYSHDTEKIITDEQKAWQKAGFLAQIALAQELELPLVVHCRADHGKSDAYEDMYEILKSLNPKPSTLNVVLHCYMGDTEVTQKFLTLPNTYFSFTGNITYPVKKTFVGTRNDLTETVKLIPLERIFVETDCPFLTPQSHRGERNEPSFVVETARCVARLHGTDVPEVEQATAMNFQTVFTHVLR